MSTGYYDCQNCNPRDYIVTFNRRLLVFSIVLFLVYLLIVMSRLLGLDVVSGLILSIDCLLVNLRISSR